MSSRFDPERIREGLVRQYGAQPAFRRPLQLGDPEQCRLLREWREKLEDLAAEELLVRAGESWKEYDVLCVVREERWARVTATSRDEAEEILHDEADQEVEEVLEVALAGAASRPGPDVDWQP